jgi:hypothetical protein
MTRAVLRIAVLGGLVTAVAVVFGGAPRARSLDAFFLFLGALAMVWLVHRTRRASGADRPSTYDRSLVPPAARAATRPASLTQLERVVYLASISAFDVHMRLRPRLRLVAEHRLARRGVPVDSPEADDLLGDDLADLVRPGRPRPEDPFAPGMPLERQRAALERLERI